MHWLKWIRQFFAVPTGGRDLPVAAAPDEVLVGAETDEETGEAAPEAASKTEPLPAEEAPVIRRSGSFDVAWLTDTGRLRPHNEDGVFIFVGEQQSSDALPRFGLFILADGMGGHQAGEAASALAGRVVAGHLISEVYLPLLTGSVHTATQPSLTEVMAAALTKADQVVNRTLPGSGTTLTCGLVLGMRLFIGHVGDSRAYLRRDGGDPEMLTTDHSVVGQMVAMGQLSQEDAQVHPQRNMLYRAVGQGGSLEVEVLTQALRNDDELLFCSDGLWGLLCEEEMWGIIDAAPSLESACARLVAKANAAGGNDNISVILVKTEQERV